MPTFIVVSLSVYLAILDMIRQAFHVQQERPEGRPPLCSWTLHKVVRSFSSCAFGPEGWRSPAAGSGSDVRSGRVRQPGAARREVQEGGRSPWLPRAFRA